MRSAASARAGWCEIERMVTLPFKEVRVAQTSGSVAGSSAVVTSSNMRSTGFRTNARASAIR